MVKVAALKNLPNVLEMHKGNNQQERSARRQKDGPEHTGPSAPSPYPYLYPYPLRGGGVTLWVQRGVPSAGSALPCPLWGSQINDSCTFFPSGDCSIPCPSQQSSLCSGLCLPEKTGHGLVLRCVTIKLYY